MSISILISRVNCATQRGLSTFSVDAVAIAKGICRCSDASRVRISWLARNFFAFVCKMFFFLPVSHRCFLRSSCQAIHDRLGKLKTHPEEDVIKMLDASRVTNDWGGGGRPPLSRALKLERDCLLRLGTSLGRCAEKLVRLALLDAQRMATTRPPSASRPDCIQQWAYFIGALTPALDHTEMETKVRSGASRAFFVRCRELSRTVHNPKNHNAYCDSKSIHNIFRESAVHSMMTRERA